MSKVKLETNDVMLEIAKAITYRQDVNELLYKIGRKECAYDIKRLVNQFIESHKGEV